MPTPTIVYTARDGTQFATEVAALNHERLLGDVEDAMMPLGKVPPAVREGKGWVQHSERAYRRAHRALVKLTAPHVKGFDNLYAACINAPDTVHPMGLMGRVMSDNGGPLSDGWHRLGFIDAQFREHQQPYYAINGPSKEQVCVEDRS